MSDELENVEANDRFDVVIFGIKVGTASGWDQYGDNGQIFYEFQPIDSLKETFGELQEDATLALDPFGNAGEVIVIPTQVSSIENACSGIEFMKLLLEASSNALR